MAGNFKMNAEDLQQPPDFPGRAPLPGDPGDSGDPEAIPAIPLFKRFNVAKALDEYVRDCE
jgi:hypothetical protein